MGEITIILLLALIFLGPKKLPELASGLGKLIREIRKTTSDVKNEIQLDDIIRKPMEELREAMTLHPEELKRRDRLRKELEELAKKAAEVEADIKDSEPNAQDVAEAAAEAAAQAGNGEPSVDATVAEGMNVPGSAASASPTADDYAKTPPPVPSVPGAAPTGTISRAPGGAIPTAIAQPTGSAGHAPPAPPLAAVLARGSAAHPPAERRTAAAGTDFLRSLRAVPDGQRTPASKPVTPPRDAASSAADRSNATQTLTEADLAAITVRPPPPPASPGQTGKSQPPAPPPTRLPGTTPPKSSDQ